MNLDKFEKIINEAFENKEKIDANSDKSIVDAIRETIELTDQGKIRVRKFSCPWLIIFNPNSFHS